MGESLKDLKEWGLVEKLGRLKPTLVVLKAGFLHLELRHHIHQDHNERMQNIILHLNVQKMVILPAMPKAG